MINIHTAPQKHINTSSLSDQSGTILLISLVFLTLMSLAGAATLRMSTFDQKISGNIIDKQTAQQNAEAALAHAQVFLADLEHDESQIGCTGTNCFPEDDCSGGLCFFGDWTNHDNISTCTADNTAESSSTFFQNQDAWNDSAFTVNNNSKYFIDFRCFSNASGMTQPLYRITAFATGKTEEARTMVQSFYMPTTVADIPAMISARNNFNFQGALVVQYVAGATQLDTANTSPLSYGGNATGTRTTYANQFQTPFTAAQNIGSSTPLGTAPQYLARYFGVNLVSEIPDEFNLTETILPNEFYSHNYNNGNKIVIIDGDLNVGPNDTFPSGADDVIVIINGNVTVLGKHAAFDAANLTSDSDNINPDPTDFSMLYIAGDLELGTGGRWRHEGVLAVEGDFNFRGALTIAAESEDPAAILSQARNFNMKITGWSDKTILF
jgi:type IV pilus assembly protein PilX